MVVDDGFGWWPGVSAVELAIAAGVAEITMLTPSGALATGLPHEPDQLFPRLAERASDPLLPHHRRRARRPRGSAPPSGETDLVPADLVVFVGERRPVGLAGPPASARVQLIGDAVMPRRGARDRRGRAAADAILGR